jgi:hypothetical protein
MRALFPGCYEEKTIPFKNLKESTKCLMALSVHTIDKLNTFVSQNRKL